MSTLYKNTVLLLFFAMIFHCGLAQTGTITGRVFNEINNESIPFANVIIDSTQMGTVSDENGRYKIDNIKPGVYNLTVSFIGFKTAYFYEIQVTSAASVDLNIPMSEESALLDQVIISTNRIEKSEESPLSKQTIGATEKK